MSDSEDGMRSRSGSQASSVDSDGAFDFDSDGDFSGGVRIDTILIFHSPITALFIQFALTVHLVRCRRLPCPPLGSLLEGISIIIHNGGGHFSSLTLQPHSPV